MPTRLARATRRIRDALLSPGSLFDLQSAALLVSLGMWMVPGWMQEVQPRLAADLQELAPVPVWGLAIIAIGIVLGVASIARSITLHIISSFLAIVVWWTLGLLFFMTVHEQPPRAGRMMLVPLMVFVLLRWLAIPGPETAKKNSERASAVQVEQGR